MLGSSNSETKAEALKFGSKCGIESYRGDRRRDGFTKQIVFEGMPEGCEHENRMCNLEKGFQSKGPKNQQRPRPC